jgi:uncharacterized protein
LRLFFLTIGGRVIRRFFLFVAALTLALFSSFVAAQCVSLTAPGTAYQQNFDTLSNTAGSTTNTLAIVGWLMNETGGGARDNEQYAVDTGAGNAGDTYSYGAAAAADRALGSLRSGSLIPSYGACFTNNTGVAVTSLNIAYTGEQWRLGTVSRTDQINFEYSTDSTSLTTGTWTSVSALNFVTPNTTTTGAKDGNAAGNRTALASTITGLSIANGATFWIRWVDTDASGADDGLAVDDFSLTPNPTALPNLSIDDVSLNEADAGTTSFTFTVTLSSPAGAGGVTFDIATADNTATTANSDYVAQTLTAQTIPQGSSIYTFTVLVNGDTAAETNETFFVNVTNVTGATVTDGQGEGTIVNDEITLSRIHDVQGSGAATPIPGSTVSVEAIVIGSYQGANQLQGFFLQEEDTDTDADPNTSEGIFVFCGTCPTTVSEGQRVRVTGVVSEFNDMTQITASTAASVVVTNGGNNLAQVTPAPISLPIVGDVDAYYEAREGMRVTFTNTLTVSEYFELARFGQIVLYEGARPLQFTEENAPNAVGLVAHEAALARRRVILDDETNAQNAYLTQTEGQQAIYHPRANGGLSNGTQGADFFRGGDTVNGLTGVLHWSFPGTGANTWRVRPTVATPAVFTVANPRPATPPNVGGAIKAASVNMLNYFTTIDTTASTSSGTCGPSATLDCRGADSVTELNRQRERASIVLCGLNADVVALMEMENTTASDTVNDLLSAVNTRCGGTTPYSFVNTGGTLGTDAIRVNLIYRMGVLSPVGVPLSDLDPIHSRPPTAQTFDVIDSANPAFGQRFTAIANHLKSKGCGGATGADIDQLDGQGCFADRRTQQAARMLTWISGTVLPAAGDPDVLMLGDFNSYAKETPVTTLVNGGYTDLASTLLGAGTYSYLFNGQLGHLDYAFSSASLTPQVKGIGIWHINADEPDLFDYSDTTRDTGEATFEEKPDGSALTPPRALFVAGAPYRAADHDPVLVGLFPVAELSVSKTDSPDPVGAGNNLTYTITVTNTGPDAATTVALTDTLPTDTTFVSLSSPAGWSCSTPAVGATGSVSCNTASMAIGTAVFTLTVNVDASVAGGTIISNTASVTANTADSDSSNDAATTTTTVAAAAMSPVFTALPTAIAPGQTYTNLKLDCTNSGSGIANAPTCVPSASTGTVSAIVCAPSSPATLANGGVIACTFSYTAQGLNGGDNESTTTVTFSGSSSASNVNSGTPSIANANVAVLDAVDDTPSAVSNDVAQQVNVLSNDGFGTSTASAVTVTASANGVVSCTGCVGAPSTLTVNANGTVGVPALATIGSYQVPYRICAATANPSPIEAACDTATAIIVVRGADMVSRVNCTPAAPTAGSAVSCVATCTNNGPAVAANATCAISNAASLPGAPTASCPGSPAATLAVGASLSCTVSFTMPAATVVTVSAGAAASNDPSGTDPTVSGNSASVQLSAFAAVAVPALGVGGLLCLIAILITATRRRFNSRK